MTIATDKPTSLKINKIEQAKAEKDGLKVKEQLEEFSQVDWKTIDKTDLEMRLKWMGIFYRPVTPGKFMMRLRVPNGVISSEQLKVLANVVQRYGDDGSADITTRQNIQLRGISLQDVPEIFTNLKSVGLTSIQSGMDNVRNITGSPVAGIDIDELIDTREIAIDLQNMLTNYGEGNPQFSNLPRKLNIAIEGGKDNSIHAEINDIALMPAYREGQIGFNVLIGGYLSAQRCAEALPMNVWIPATSQAVLDFCRAVLNVYSQNGLKEGLRVNRTKARLMLLIDKWGMEKFRSEVETELGYTLQDGALSDETTMEKRDFLGVHPQKQTGFSYVGLHIPVGRLTAEKMFELARLSEVYGISELRLTVEQNVIIPFVSNEYLPALLEEPLLQDYSINPNTLVRSLISCTGSQYCNFALVETKQQGLALARQLDEEFEFSQRVRIHWTGCPNSCGQAQVGDIGLMGTKVRKEGKTVDGVDLYLGGKVGKEAHLGSLYRKSIPCDELPDVLREVLTEKFGAVSRHY